MRESFSEIKPTPQLAVINDDRRQTFPLRGVNYSVMFAKWHATRLARALSFSAFHNHWALCLPVRTLNISTIIFVDYFPRPVSICWKILKSEFANNFASIARSFRTRFSCAVWRHFLHVFLPVYVFGRRRRRTGSAPLCLYRLPARNFRLRHYVIVIPAHCTFRPSTARQKLAQKAQQRKLIFITAFEMLYTWLKFCKTWKRWKEYSLCGFLCFFSG